MYKRQVLVFEKGVDVVSCRLEELPELLKDGTITGETIVFDDLVSTVGDLHERFRVPLKASWMARFL